jgi:hypothetical protein
LLREGRTNGAEACTKIDGIDIWQSELDVLCAPRGFLVLTVFGPASFSLVRFDNEGSF